MKTITASIWIRPLKIGYLLAGRFAFFGTFSFFVVVFLASRKSSATVVMASLSSHVESCVHRMAAEGNSEDWAIDGPVRAPLEYDVALSSIISKSDSSRSEGLFDGLLKRFMQRHLKNNDFDQYKGILADLLKNRRRQGQGTNVLDLFGSGFFVEDQTLADSITGLRFGPFDREKFPENYRRSLVPPEVLGDIFSPTTWQKLDESMLKRSIPAMDLVVMRPEGGWRNLRFKTSEEQANALEYIIKRVLPRLSKTGRFYFQISINEVPGPIAKHPSLKRLAKEIFVTTPFKLILDSGRSRLDQPNNEEDRLYSLSGALVPK